MFQPHERYRLGPPDSGAPSIAWERLSHADALAAARHIEDREHRRAFMDFLNEHLHYLLRGQSLGEAAAAKAAGEDPA